MSGRIEKQDLVGAEALKVFPELLQQISATIKEAKALKSEFKDVNSLLKLSEAIKKTKTNTDQLTASQKELDRQTKALIREKAKLVNVNSKINKQLIETQEKTRAATRAMREQAKESLGLAKKTGGLRGAFNGMIKSVGVYAAAIFGITRLIQFFTRDLLGLTKKLDSLHFSMETIIKDQDELAATNIFLSKTATNYGLNILTLTERYIKFRAATQQSNLSAKETMKIFDSTAKAAAVLGLKTDEVNGVFLALEQMVSKGKVTTEELRRQLGERLPGAMGIMADAMEVSISDLDKMLKKGEVLSSEALPKFADALEKAYGIEAVNKVNTLAAAQGRLTTSWVQFVDELKASKAYIGIIDELNDALNQIAFTFRNPSIRNDTEDYFDMLEKGFDKQGKAFVNLIEQMDNAEKQGLPKSKKFFIEFVDSIGFSLKEAEILYEEYIRRVNLFVEEQGRLKTKPFDIDQYKKDLDKAESDFTDFNKIRSDDLKQSAADNSKAIDEENQTFKQFILNQIELLKTAEKVAKNKHMVEQGMADIAKRRGRLRTKEEMQQLEDSFTNYQNTTLARIELEKRLFDLQEKKGDTLAIEKANNKKRLSQLEEMFKFGEGLKTNELQKEVKLLEIKKQLNDRLTQFTKEGSKERAQIEAESQKIQTDIAQKNAEVRMNIDKEWIDGNQKLMQEWSDEEISAIFERADLARVARAEIATNELVDAKNRGSKRKAIEIKLGVDLLEIENAAQQEIIDSNLTTLEEKEKAVARQLQLEEQLQKLIRKGAIETEKIKREEFEKTLTATGDLLQQGFRLADEINNRALANSERRYELETQAAGENIFRQLSAERKFEKEQAKIKRRQAIANKAAAAAEIIINTAIAISKVLGQTGLFGLPLVPLVAGLGALQLATVLAQPIPAFEKGGKHEGGIAEFSEGGKPELFFPASGGNPLLTPSKHTVANMPAGEFIPHDETQRILANQAYSQTFDMIDMSQTNRHLSRIDKNTSESVNIVGNYKIVKKPGFSGKYRI